MEAAGSRRCPGPVSRQQSQSEVSCIIPGPLLSKKRSSIVVLAIYSFFSEAVLHLPCSLWLPLSEVHGGGTPAGPPEEEDKLVSFFCPSFLGKIAPVSICPCEKDMKLTIHSSCRYLLRAPQMALHPDKTKTLLGTKYCTNWPRCSSVQNQICSLPSCSI